MVIDLGNPGPHSYYIHLINTTILHLPFQFWKPIPKNLQTLWTNQDWNSNSIPRNRLSQSNIFSPLKIFRHTPKRPAVRMLWPRYSKASSISNTSLEILVVNKNTMKRFSKEHKFHKGKRKRRTLFFFNVILKSLGQYVTYRMCSTNKC